MSQKACFIDCYEDTHIYNHYEYSIYIYIYTRTNYSSYITHHTQTVLTYTQHMHKCVHLQVPFFSIFALFQSYWFSNLKCFVILIFLSSPQRFCFSLFTTFFAKGNQGVSEHSVRYLVWSPVFYNLNVTFYL